MMNSLAGRSMSRRVFYMREALKLAQEACAKDEVPVGAVIVHDESIVARTHNQVETLKDPTAHAEMIALTQATATLGQKWLHDCDLYVTLEPCCMCAGALVLARLRGVYIGTMDPKAGACGSVFDIARDQRLNHRLEVRTGILAAESRDLLQKFFAHKRKR